MSVIQSNQTELRYMKRKNLKEESQLVGNWYRDIIRSYGIDCIYHKLDTKDFENFNGQIDQNAILQRAYGININPDYSCSAHMITFPEVEQDIFQLQKIGAIPNSDITFYFDSNDFACALAEQCGQYKEYKIKETTITCEVPECTDEIRWNTNPETGEKISTYVSSDIFPYELGLGYAENYECGLMNGKLSVALNGYEYNTKTTIPCDPYEHTDFKIKFSANESLYRSMMHDIHNEKYLQTLLFLTFIVDKVLVGYNDSIPIYKSILTGKIHGGVLFYSLEKIGKYMDKIHPEVGDILTIDYPDENNPEKYEIVDCFDKQLTQDGISPLLHNYIWKCKARRYVNNYDNFEETEMDKRTQEKLKFEQIVDEEITKKISGYKNNEDAVYGGYDGIMTEYDQKIQDHQKAQKFDFLDDGTAIDLIRFGCGSRLVTTGYELLFININGEAYQLTTEDHEITVHDVVFEQGLRWLKASDSCLVFVNVEGKSYKLVEDKIATQDKLQLCLNSLFDTTLDDNVQNQRKQNFYKFKETRTILWATETELFCKLASNQELYQLV